MEINRDKNQKGDIAIISWCARDGRRCEVHVSTAGDIRIMSGVDRIDVRHVGTDGVRVAAGSTEIHLNDVDGA
jgi:hypothetical protein